MKRALTLIVLLILSYVAVAIGKLQGIDALWYAGLGFGCAVLLAMVLGVFKLVAHFIGNSLTSILFTFTSLVIVGVLAYFGKVNAFVGYTVGTVCGVMLFLMMFRKLAKWAQGSMIFGEVFSFVSNYKVRSYLYQNRIESAENMNVYNVDYKNLILVLNEQMGYSTVEAKKAASYAISELPVQSSFEDKVRESLKYLSPDTSQAVYTRGVN